jgi:uncharacterized protein YbjT (DUF2867 family)
MSASRKIAVAGATGRVGSHLVDVLAQRGHQVVDWGTLGEVSYVPRMRTQLVAARTVAEALADLATDPEPAGPGGSVPEIAGPLEESLVEMAALLAEHRGGSVRIVGVSDPADPDRDLYEDGSLLPHAHATLAGPTFEQWLGGEAPASEEQTGLIRVTP